MSDWRGAPTRRGVLAGGLALLGTGCLGGGRAGGDGAGERTDERTLSTHPAARHLDEQPRLGPDPAEASGVVVAFEDPSCPRCAAFERTTVPKIRSELVDTGKAAFVFRNVPIVYPWGKPATQALEATFARDADAVWTLAHHYFADRESFDADNVLDRTRAFLDAETDLDGAAVVADAEAKAYDDAVQTDLAAGEAAGVTGTPTVFLFRDGTYRTRATGSVSYDLVSGALGL